jgi:hypothetical protein
MMCINAPASDGPSGGANGFGAWGFYWSASVRQSVPAATTPPTDWMAG